MRLCRLMCGRSMTFRKCSDRVSGLCPRMRGEVSLNQKLILTERQSLSAHRAAEPPCDRKSRDWPDPQEGAGRRMPPLSCGMNLAQTLERRIMRKNSAG